MRWTYSATASPGCAHGRLDFGRIARFRVPTAEATAAPASPSHVGGTALRSSAATAAARRSTCLRRSS